MRDRTTDTGPEKQTEPAAARQKPGFVSAGSHLHKWGSYLSVDWVLNTITGVSFSYWANYHPTGQKYWSNFWKEGFDKVLKPIVKDVGARASSAKYGTMFMSIIAGGMFTLPPLMILENKKVKKSITKFYDGIIYGKDKVEHDPKFQQSYEAIDKEPEKDGGSGLLARFAALAPLLAIVIVPFTKRLSNKVWFNHVENGSEWTATKLGLSAEKTFQGVSAEGAKERWKFIHENVAMDFGLGIPYAIMHEFWYNVLANNKKHAPEQKNDPVPSKPARALIQKPMEPTESQPASKIQNITGRSKLMLGEELQRVT